MLERFERFSLSLAELTRHWHKLSADEMEKYGLRSTHSVYLLTMLRHPEGMTATQLVESCARDKSDVSRMMSILGKKGFVVKNGAGKSTYRGVFLLTDSGREAAEAVRRRADRTVEIAGQGLSEADRAAFYETLAVITDNLRRLSRDGVPEEDGTPTLTDSPADGQIYNTISNLSDKGEPTMREYVILTDSGCDIRPDVLKEWRVPAVNLTFRFEGEDAEYTGEDMPVKDFYDRMRAGGVAKTAAVNPDAMSAAMESILKEGRDVLYLGFSSGLSTTYNSARIAAGMLAEKYPEAQIVTVDTLAASAGQGLLVYLAVQKRDAGATITEVADYITENRLHMCHWFTVDDLVYLKRGGRVSPTAAFVGGMLGIKPVMHVDNEGKLIPMAKVRGRKVSLNAIAEKYGETAIDPAGGKVFICNADCMDDVNYLSDLLKTKYGATVDHVTDVGPVIGAHSGPGTIALFYLGKER